MSRSNYTKPYPCTKSERSGKHYVTISETEQLGSEYSKDGNTGVLVRFENDSIVHEEVYYIGGHNYTKYLKLFREVGLQFIYSDNIVGKKLWIVIKHIISGDDRKVKLESVHANEPNVPLLIEEYE